MAMMNVESLEEGDTVFAAVDFFNDGGVPNLPEDALLAKAGSRGVIVRIGHLEQNPNRTVFLVRFEDEEKNLGLPIGCWAEELTVEENAAQ
jgi:nitrogen fixation protein NifZ